MTLLSTVALLPLMLNAAEVAQKAEALNKHSDDGGGIWCHIYIHLSVHA